MEGVEGRLKHIDQFRKRGFLEPYPEAHTIHGDSDKLPPDGCAQPLSPAEQCGIGLSYGTGDFSPYTQYLGECPEMWNGMRPNLDCKIPYSAGNIHPHTGLLLWSLVVNMRPTVIIETGTFFGYSTWFLAQALQWWRSGGKVYTIDTDFRHVADCVRKHPLVRMMSGSSIDVLPKLLDDLNGEVHFAFLDSYKRQALAEFQLLDSAIVPGGIVAFHDTQVFNTGKGLWSLLKTHPYYDRMLFVGTPAVDSPHRYFGNADDRGLFVLRKREANPFLDVADHGTHSETLVATGEPLGDLLIGIKTVGKEKADAV